MRRPEQLSAVLQKVVGAFIARRVELPEGVLATVTRVDVGRNTRGATVWVSVLPSARAEDVLATLHRHLYELQGYVNRIVQVRPTPRLSVRLDRGPERSGRIEKIVKRLHDDPRAP